MNRRGIICGGAAHKVAVALAHLDPEFPVWVYGAPPEDALLDPDHFDFSKSTAHLLHLDGLGMHARMDASHDDDPSGWVSVLRRARAAGLTTSLAMASGAPDEMARLVLPCLAFVNTLIISDCAAAILTGIDIVSAGVTSTGAARRAAVALLVKGPFERVVIHFPGGCIAATPDGEVRAKPSVAVPSAEMKRGDDAGDAFAAGMLYAIHEAWPIGESLSLGLCAAAWHSASLPAAPGTVEDCLAVARLWGWRAPI